MPFKKQHFLCQLTLDNIPQKHDNDFEKMWTKLSLDFLSRLNIKLINKKTTLKEFELIKYLGEGSFGKVILTKQIKSNNFFALKIMKKKPIVKNKQIEIAKNEKNILILCKFKFILSFITAFQTNDFLCLCIELAPGGDFYELLKKNIFFNSNTVKFYSSQILLGLQYLHIMKIVYRDLKPENILISKYGYLKLADLGLAKLLNNKPRTYTFCGTPEYIAPEIISNKGYGCSVDYWSFGVMIYEMFIGKTPFYHKKEIKMFHYISRGKYSLSKSLINDARNLIKHLLQIDPTRRYGNLKNGTLDIRFHSFYNNINWVSIYEQTIEPPFPIKVIKYDEIIKDENFDDIKDYSETMQYEKEFNSF